jgi:hypothetical protein
VFSLTANRAPGPDGADLDFAHVVQIGFSFPAYVDPTKAISLELRGATTTNRIGKTKLLDLSRAGRYVLAVQPIGEGIIRQVGINGKPYRLGPMSNGWTLTEPLDLPAGSTTISFDSAEVGRLLLWQRSQYGAAISGLSPSQSLSMAAQPLAHPATYQQLNYFENFDPGWVVRGAPRLLHYRANGFINSYVGDWQTGASVVYAYTPDDWIALGRVVSVLVLTVTIVGLMMFVLISARAKLRLQRALRKWR